MLTTKGRIVVDKFDEIEPFLQIKNLLEKETRTNNLKDITYYNEEITSILKFNQNKNPNDVDRKNLRLLRRKLEKIIKK